MNKLYMPKQLDMFIIRKQACEHNLVVPVVCYTSEGWGG